MENVKDVSPFTISKFNGIFGSNFNVKADDILVIVEILKPLAGYSVEGAFQILDSAKSVLLECTSVHEEYKP